MLLLEGSNIKKYYSDRLIVSFDELKVYSGDRIGIIGQNGSGKTTLMNILSGDVAPDEGFVKRYCEISYIRQFSEEDMKAGPKILKEFDLSRKAGQNAFSGGEHTRIKLANALNDEKLILFADEPTANLDYKGIEILKNKLSKVETLLLISHDRALLDELCNKILEVKDGKIRIYNGNYSFYKQQSDMEFESALQEYEKYIDAKESLESAIQERKRRAKSMKKAPSRMGNSEARLHKRAANEKQEKIHNSVNSLITRLEKLETKEKPKESPKIKLDFSLTYPPQNKYVIYAEGLSFSYGSNKIFENAGFNLCNGLKTALYGENGSGKTTLLNLIAGNNEKSIQIVPKAKIGYFCQGFENLDHNKSVLENVMKESVQIQSVARTILARLLIHGDSVYKKVGDLSGGERIKVSFAKLFVSSANVLLLDEPTNYLDMLSIEALQEVLREYEGTVLFVSHDRAFVNAVADRLFIINDKKIIDFEGNIDDFELAEKKKHTADMNGIDKIAVQMRLAQIAAKISSGDKDREALENEYLQLTAKLKTMEQ